ncbi:MAG: cytochrome c3 family protein [Candidatus Binatia bacterium]
MAQLFKPSSNTYTTLILRGVGLLAGGALFGLYQFNTLPYVTRAYESREQPVQFSHKHHNGELGIDCRYCHTQVEDTAFAGIPATQICMNCHAQIWKDAPILEPVRASYRTGESLEWTRVHDLADFAYFNHAAHLAKGVGCASCHGDVTQMNLTYQVENLSMGWCLDCHRDPAKAVRPKDKLFDTTWVADNQRELGAKLVAEYHVEPRTDCSTCHR